VVRKKKPTTTPKTTTAPTPTPTPVVVANKSDTPSNYSSSPSSSFMHKDMKIMGVSGMAFYEINSQFESLYVNFPTQNIKGAGFGFIGFFEYGFNEHISAEVDMGYSRLTYTNKFKNTTKKNFFLMDVLFHYYFTKDANIAPYLSAGGGVYVSSGSSAPVLDVGVGSHFKVSKNISIKVDLLYKTAIILNRFEGRVGVAFHF